ncbi:hypothetical protein GXP67_22475 [Rhodocytophaga rosea]|uniref:DUF4252 domain-containing protein n=1 Tax=Rhodocytophaga rosea TaxID=2704465 RepID=A0A6C0GMF9_9BACT|nr:hypothetical protein [Rhodocytophaga rosea]QHT69209.1 hypothetical protein GXP67_22475 [Rhodocytophaga rosea]
MKKIVLLFTLCTFSISWVFAQNIKKLDEKNGFKELTLGSSYQDAKQYLSELPIESNAKGKTAIYAVTDQSFLEVGESEINKITASFFNDRLESINIDTKGHQNFKDLLDVLTKGYGKGEKKNTYIEEYHWLGKKVNMSYKMNANTKDGKLTIVSKEIAEQNEKHKKDLKKGVVNEL